MEWTTERRYRRYEDWTKEEKQAIQDHMAKSPWHTHYHVEPKAGLLNDPNGFPTLMENGSCFTKISHLVQPMG